MVSSQKKNVSSPVLSYLADMTRNFFRGIMFSLGFFIIGGVITYTAIAFSSTPSEDGVFMTFFNKMLMDTNPDTTTGKVNDSDKVDGLHASELGGGLGAATSGGGIYAVTMMLDDGVTCPAGYTQFRVNSPLCNGYESNGNLSIMCSQYTSSKWGSWNALGQYMYQAINSGYSTVCVKD